MTKEVRLSGHSDDLVRVGLEEFGAWGGIYIEFLNGDVLHADYDGSWWFEHVEGDAGVLAGSFYEAENVQIFSTWSSWPRPAEELVEAVDDAISTLVEEDLEKVLRWALTGDMK